MNGRSAIEIVLYSGLLPAVVAFGVYFAAGWVPLESVGKRYRAGIAFALAVFAGFAATPTSKSIVPTQFWDYVPYLGMFAAFAAGVSLAEGVSRVERWIITALVAALAAWLIVPAWDDLAPSRPIQVAALATGIAVLTLLLEPLAARLDGRAFPFWLMLVAGASAVIILAEVSETFGRLAALPASALLGCWLAGCLVSGAREWRCLALPYATVVGGYAFAGMVYPTPPLVLLMLVPLVPLLLWLGRWGPLAQPVGWRALAVDALCVLVPVVVIAAFILMRSAGSEW